MIAQVANVDPVGSAVEALQLVYTIVLSLAIGSAFSKFVNDREADGDEGSAIHWCRIFSLIALLLLAVPFIHGMNRYFFDVYVTPTGRPEPYGIYLLFDTVVFTIEAGLFFILSRLLRSTDCKKFVLTIVMLLWLDILWGSFVAWRHTPEIVGWVCVNACAIPLLVAVWWWLRRATRIWWLGPSLTLAILALRTVCDYLILWTFYFPS